MNKGYKLNNRDQKKTFKKYRGAIIKAAIGGIIAVLGLTIPGAFITDLLGKIVTFDGETLNLIAVFVKTIMMAGGVATTTVNAVKANVARKDMQDLQDEEKDIVREMINENEEQKEKIQALKERLVTIKEDSNNKVSHYNNPSHDKEIAETKSFDEEIIPKTKKMKR